MTHNKICIKSKIDVHEKIRTDALNKQVLIKYFYVLWILSVIEMDHESVETFVKNKAFEAELREHLKRYNYDTRD